MAKIPAIIITGIAIVLLVIYGADVAAGIDSTNKQGFLAMDHQARGFGLGGPALVLPIIAYFITRNDSSKELGVMIIIVGILIIAGGITVIGIADLSQYEETGRNLVTQSVPLLVGGGIQIGLGALKIKKS